MIRCLAKSPNRLQVLINTIHLFDERESCRRNWCRILFRQLLWLVAATGLFSCAGAGTYRAYEGAPRSELQVAVLQGEAYLRQDWLNRYVDSVRFHRVDDIEIEDSDNYGRVEVAPGFHDISVYFYWDLGNQRGLSQALVQYASSRESLSRSLRFNARAGEHYTVHAEPIFYEGRRDITTLSHVNFWVEDEQGNSVVTREEGRYVPSP